MIPCSYCPKGEMVVDKSLGEGWFKCKKCGATYSDDPKFLKKKRGKKTK